MAEEIKPCPFCGEESVLMRPTKRGNLIWDWLRKPAKDDCLVMCGNPLCSSKLHSFGSYILFFLNFSIFWIFEAFFELTTNSEMWVNVLNIGFCS